MNWKFWKKKVADKKLVCSINYELADGYYYLKVDAPEGLSEDDIAADFALFINELNLNRNGIIETLKNELFHKIPTISFKMKLEDNLLIAENSTPTLQKVLNRRPIIGPESVFTG